jgi:hypothetical protein
VFAAALKMKNLLIAVAALAAVAAVVFGIYEFTVRQADDAPESWTAESRDVTWKRVKSGADILARNPAFGNARSCTERRIYEPEECAENIIVTGWRRECVLHVIEREYPNPQDVDALEDKRLMKEVKRLVVDQCP